MKQFKDMYKLALLVEGEYQKIMSDPEKVESMEGMTKGYALPNRQACLKLYADTYYEPLPITKRIYQEALRREYLVHYEFGTSIDSIEVNPGPGIAFIQVLGKFRLGMWADILRHYTPYSFVISLVAIVISLFALFVK